MCTNSSPPRVLQGNLRHRHVHLRLYYRVKKGWLKDPAYAEGARKGWLALQTYVDADGMMDKVCVGTGQNKNVEFYLTRPTQKGNSHGQAPLLWCAVALLQ